MISRRKVGCDEMQATTRHQNLQTLVVAVLMMAHRAPQSKPPGVASHDVPATPVGFGSLDTHKAPAVWDLRVHRHLPVEP